MNREQFEAMLRLLGCDDNTVQFGLNAYDIGEEYGTYKCTQDLRPSFLSRGSVRDASPMVGAPSEAGGLEEVRTGKMQGT
jgi:hypothetical protein